MSRKYQWLTLAFVLIIAASLYAVYEYRYSIAMLNPKGWVALEERNLMITATVLMLIVVVPVFILTIYIAAKFHKYNKNGEYYPDWDNSFLLEVIWWGFPFIIVIFLSIIAWETSHSLDPFKPLESDVAPVKVQVVALRWKWLFIYPEYDIATVNYLKIPEKTPINFEITADAPMNSFWLPQLGGQIYAMSGMRSKLHIIADETGVFRGSSSNMSGEGFAGMFFDVHSVPKKEFDSWIAKTKQSDLSLDQNSYQALANPSKFNPPAFYQLGKKDLFEYIIMIPMMSGKKESSSSHQETKE